MNILNRFIFSQINFDTLAILFSLMLVVAGYTKLGYIDVLAEKMIDKAKNQKVLSFMLIYSCFFMSMLVTNDVALIIMVPFAIGVITKSGKKDNLIKIIVLQTIAANLGSMLTPIGNPQNVYLYRFYNMKPGQFFGAVFPYVLTALVLIFILVISERKVCENIESSTEIKAEFKFMSIKTLIYTVSLVLCVLSVMGILNVFFVLVLVTVAVTISDWKLIKMVNYGLLIKFIILFILVGDLAEIQFIKESISHITEGHEFISGVIFSQFLSNVPAAIMLSRFTNNGTALLEGVNVGGLGTLIASMASMISFEYYGNTMGADRKKYIISFTAYNIVFLIIMLIIKLVIE